MTSNDVEKEDIDKEFRNNSQLDDLLDHNPTRYSFQYLLNPIKKVGAPMTRD